jgi:hypothetical protein
MEKNTKIKILHEARKYESDLMWLDFSTWTSEDFLRLQRRTNKIKEKLYGKN